MGIGSFVGMAGLPFVGSTALASAGELAGGYMQYRGQQQTNEMNMELGREQMDFQDRMSSTAYQRAVTDMKAAGLNPALAYQQGSASSPSGALPQVSNPASGFAASSADAIRTVSGLMNDMVMRDKTRAETNVADVMAHKVEQDTRTGSSTAAKIEQEIDNLKLERGRIMADTYRLRASGVEIGSKFDLNRSFQRLNEIDAELRGYGVNMARNESEAANTWFGKHVMPYMSSVVKGAGSAAALGTLRPRRGMNVIQAPKSGFSPNYGFAE